MKKKFIVAISIMAVFALSIAAFAYTRSSTVVATGDSCCTGDSCPMKKKKAEGAKHESCCDKCDCCKDGKCEGDSCPMKKHAGMKHESTSMHDESHKNVVMVSGESCCGCACCGGEKKKTSDGV